MTNNGYEVKLINRYYEPAQGVTGVQFEKGRVSSKMNTYLPLSYQPMSALEQSSESLYAAELYAAQSANDEGYRD